MDDLVRFSSPFDRPLHFLLLELLVLASTVLVFTHAVLRYRAGDRRHLFQWIVLTSYGVQMELVAFNFLSNYEHAQFTVQLYGGQLPLYVTGLYGSFMYAGMKLAERLNVHPLIEALLAGFAMCLIDVPFDLAGVALGWWTWLDTDPVLAFRWLGVPVTSYYWYLIFGAVAVLLCRGLWPRLEKRLEKRAFGLAVPIALFTGSLVIVFGVLGFLPFHALSALGLSHGTIVALHLLGCSILALGVRSTPLPTERLVLLSGLSLPGAITLVLAGTAITGVEGVLPRLLWSSAALVGLVAIGVGLPLRRPALALAPSNVPSPTP